MAQETILKLLQVGEKAPNIQITDQDGKPISLQDFKGQKLIVFIYPKDNSGTCLKEGLSMKEGYESLKEAGFEVLGVSPDSERTHRNYISKRELPFNLLSDPDHQLIKAFGAWGPKKMYGKEYMGIYRTTFLLDEEGTITHVIEKVVSKEHAQQILDLIQDK